MGKGEFHHTPVMLQEALEELNIRSGGVYVDCTLGGGGHAAAILERLGDGGGLLVGMDRDPAALAAAKHRLAGGPGRVRLVQANFNALGRVVRELELPGVDGILFDLGVSSPQLDEPERGFSYHEDAPLDMRMDPSQPHTAADLVNDLPEAELVRIIREYGEERWAARIARRIGDERRRERIESTGRLAEIIKGAIPAAARRSGPHPARRTFQALRIAVNDELSALHTALVQAVQCANAGGRIVVISYHSLEDRIVKETFRDFARACVCPPELPVCVCGRKAVLKVITKRPLNTSEDEVRRNPRSRSAKLRAAEKLPTVLTTKEGE